MSLWGPEELDRVEEALDELRGTEPFQMAFDGVLAAVFGAVVGWWVAAGWFAATLVVRASGAMTLSMAKQRQVSRRGQAIIELVFMALLHLVFGSLLIVAFYRSGPWAGVAAMQILTAMILFCGRAAGRSAQVYIAEVVPHILNLLMMGAAVVLLSPPEGFIVMLSVSSLLAVIMSVGMWATAAASANRERAALRAAEAATAAKSAFVAMVSHELRTPISGILAGADEIRKTSGEAGARNNAQLIVDSGRMMRGLLDDLLDLSKIEAGRMSAERIDFDLRRLIHDSVRFWAPEARRQNLRFRLIGARSLPRWVQGDPTKIRQILNNLFSNALKFTARGAVTLRAAAEPRPDGRVRLTLDVTDTGQGMSGEQMERLFQPFDQLSASTARTHGGTGLGLNISRELAQMMDGDLTVSSVEGQGSAFRLIVDAPLGSPVVADGPGVSNVKAAGAVRVLVVDDHAVNRQAFALILQSFCDEVVCLADGEEALEALALQPFDVVLMDLNMPRLGGLEATRRLRAVEGPNRDTPVIALTASVSPQESEICLAAGMNSFVLKPVEARELIGAINRVLSDQPVVVRSAVA